MSELAQYTSYPLNGAPLCELWSAHVDALERHLSTNTWALFAVSVVLIVYPIARILIPALLHSIVLPDVIQTVLNLMRV